MKAVMQGAKNQELLAMSPTPPLPHPSLISSVQAHRFALVDPPAIPKWAFQKVTHHTGGAEVTVGSSLSHWKHHRPQGALSVWAVLAGWRSGAVSVALLLPFSMWSFWSLLS